MNNLTEINIRNLKLQRECNRKAALVQLIGAYCIVGVLAIVFMPHVHLSPEVNAQMPLILTFLFTFLLFVVTVVGKNALESIAITRVLAKNNVK